MKKLKDMNSTRKRQNTLHRSKTINKINNKRHNDDKTNVSTKVLMQGCHHSNFALKQSPNPKIILVPLLTSPTPIDHSNLAKHNINNNIRRRTQKIKKSEYFAYTLVLNRSVFLIATCLIVFSTLFYSGNLPYIVRMNALIIMLINYR